MKLRRLEEENEILTLQVKNNSSNVEIDNSLNEIKNRVKQDYKSIIELVKIKMFFLNDLKQF